MIALVIQIITAALQLAPLGLETVNGIKAVLAKDPAVPDGLKEILTQTVTTDDATEAMIQLWRMTNPSK